MRNDVEKKHNIISYFLITLLLAILLALSATATYLLLDTFRFVPPGGWNMRTPGVLLAFPRTYLVQSGSMEPAIKTGSIVITLPSSVYSQGEVITFSKNSKNIVTHRIQAKLYPEGASSSPVYKTAGDANENFDNWEVNNSDIIGKVVFSVPYVGYVADFAKKPQGFILLVIIPATIIIYEELKNIIRELK
ncbi:signal peptidase I, partial [Candidatus Woesebacteria bacterium RIFCSPLOWO2_01_FULL_39_10]